MTHSPGWQVARFNVRLLQVTADSIGNMWVNKQTNEENYPYLQSTSQNPWALDAHGSASYIYYLMIVSMVQLIYYYLHFFGTRKRSFLISLQRYIQDLLVSRIVETWKKWALLPPSIRPTIACASPGRADDEAMILAILTCTPAALADKPQSRSPREAYRLGRPLVQSASVRPRPRFPSCEATGRGFLSGEWGMRGHNDWGGGGG